MSQPDRPPEPDEDRWLTPAQAVAYSQMSRATLIRREQEGLLEVGRTAPGGQRRYRKRALDAMLRNNGLITLLLWLVVLGMAIRCVLSGCPVLRHFGLELPPM